MDIERAMRWARDSGQQCDQMSTNDLALVALANEIERLQNEVTELGEKFIAATRRVQDLEDLL